MSTSDMINRFRYHTPDDEQVVKHADIRNRVLELAIELDATLPDGVAKGLAINQLEEAMFWAHAAIARN